MKILKTGIVVFMTVLLSPLAVGAPIWLEKDGYASFADSPFYGNSLSTFYLEDFEDGLFNTPGVTGVANTPGITLAVSTGWAWDSVDGDDGNVNGSSTNGHSLAGYPNKPAENLGFTFTFDAGVLGGLPSHVGIVWTDGGYGVSTQFEAFDASGQSLGIIGPVQTGDYSFYGTTAEDYFFGVIYEDGISSFTIRDPGGRNNMEVDHLQYGLNVAMGSASEPSTLLLAMAGLLGLLAARLRRAVSGFSCIANR